VGLLGCQNKRYRAWIGWFVVLRLVLLAAAVQLSGVGHALTDAALLAFDVEHQDQECPPDRPCDDCPPGCPNCHCPNTLRTVVPQLGVEIAAIGPIVNSGASTAARQVPSGPDLPSLYRPPRSHRPVG